MKRYFTIFYWGVLVPAVGIVLWIIGGWAFADWTPAVSAIVFLAWGFLLLLASIEWLVRTRVLGQSRVSNSLLGVLSRPETQISFISDRRKITLDLASIVYIESRDLFVLVWVASTQAAAGNAHQAEYSLKSYPTRMKISQWEAALDDRFVRIHRSFIVSRAHITLTEVGRVWLGETSIEISRKYKDNI